MTNHPIKTIAPLPLPSQPGAMVQPTPLESICTVSQEQLRAAEKVVAREVRKAQALHKPPAADTLG